MLTPIEIQGKVFKSGVGYIKRDVDSYINEILINYEHLYKSNVELNDKITVLTDGIQYYKTIETTLQGALVLAEKTAVETKASADRVAETVINEAHSRAKLIVSDAKNELDALHNKTVDLIRQYELYKSQYAQLANTQLELLNKDCFNINIANMNAFTKDETLSNKPAQANVNSKIEASTVEASKVGETNTDHNKTVDNKIDDFFEFIEE